MFDYTAYSKAAVKLYCDTLYLIQPGEVAIWTIMECLDFCHFEGKTMVSTFEEKLSNCLTKSLFSQSFSIGTMLLIGAYLSKVDNFKNAFEDRLMQELTHNSITELLFNFDFCCEINKKLIQLCFSKSLFPDEKNDTVEMSLMRYGRDLLLRKAPEPHAPPPAYS